MSDEKTLEILLAVRELLNDPAHWTREVYAKNVDGAAVEPTDERAVCWCVGGAFAKVTGDEGFEESEAPFQPEAIDAWEAFKAELEGCNPYTFNDSQRDHMAVLEKLDAAIEAVA